MTPQNNKQTVVRIYQEYINQDRRELLADLVSADYTHLDGRRGREAFQGVVEGLKRGVPDIQFVVEDVLAENDRVAIRWKWTGTHRGELNGFAPSNKRLENEGIAIYQLADGKVVRSWLQTDRLGVLQQVGAVSPELGRPAARR